MSDKKLGRPRKEIHVNNLCVFAVCNQRGRMRDYIDNQRYCMIIQNAAFELALGIANYVPDKSKVDKVFWREHGYNVTTLSRHDCDGCPFYKNKNVWELVPYISEETKGSWKVEKRGAKHAKDKGRSEKKTDDQ